MRTARALSLVGCFLLVAPRLSAEAPKIDFRRDVLPILEERCFACHRGSDATGGVRLDLRAELLGETTGKPLVRVGKSGDSRLIHVVTGRVPNKVMPRKGDRLTEQLVGVLRAWIDQGLAWDETLLPAETRHTHWAFQPVRPVEVPKVRDPAWVRSPVDAFIAARYATNGLRPTPEAERRVLIRRLSLDLLGLPPSPEEVDAFVKDPSPDAYANLVERLLASPHYGERQARHWLDVARWAESEGYESNHLRPHAWRYRDWVVKSFNDDRPFADFVRAQLAGDEITPYADDNLIATGFLAAARLSSNEEDRWRQRNDILVDIVNATASAFLGLTMQCAQCHNHKFDPITARDYYRFQGFFVKGQPGNLALRDPVLLVAYTAKKPAGYDEAVKARNALYEAARERRLAQVRKGLSADQLHAVSLPMEQRTPDQERTARETDLLFQLSTGQIEAALTLEEKPRYDRLKAKVTELEKRTPDRPQTFGYYSPATSPHAVDVLPMKGFYPLPYEPAALARAKPYLLLAGEVHQPTFAVDVGWPAVFGPTPADAVAKHPRRALADWLTDPRHPLTARVYVNRVWQQHFGRGLVASSGDFGIKGTPPTHPELLDWLAAEFLRAGGSTKHLHRLIVTSSTYRQSSRPSAENTERDPDNVLLWRWAPRRLEAEAIRDGVLAVSGQLEPKLGGPSVPADDRQTRRSLYLFQKREAPPPAQALFDGPFGMAESCSRRDVTTVPLQPLYLLNSEFSVRSAAALARRVMALAGNDPSAQVAQTFALALGRTPAAEERAAAERFFARAGWQQSTTDAPPPALVQFCQAVLNLNEFVYLE